MLTRRHAVLVASARDPDIERLAAGDDALFATAATDLLAARSRAAAAVRGAGAEVIEAAPGTLNAACVRAYLYAKSRRRL